MNSNQFVHNMRPVAPEKTSFLALTPRRVVAVAGAPAGWARRQTRRGSFLVLVVGTLALMSVFAIVYVAIGRSDAGLSAGVKRNAVRDDVPKQFSEYVAGIIARDVLAITAEEAPPSQLAIRREATDYPSTVWEMRSDNEHPDRTFDPVGSYRTRWVSGGTDPRGPSDPWLAANEPTYLDYDGLGYPDPDHPFLEHKDWAHISNVAPDGRFVNLVRLRNDFGVSSLNLTVRGNDDPFFATGAGNPPTNMTDFGIAPPLTAGRIMQPAYLSSRQARAFRPIAPATGTPDDAFYTPYMWADADGDGMYDSRWIELVDTYDPNDPSNRSYSRSLLDTSSKYRYFFATRIIDLSGMVNVTTALDFTVAPSDLDRAGKTPGDVDLRRLLSLEDVYSTNPVPADPWGYQLLKQPIRPDSGTNSPADRYSAFDGPTAAGAGAWAFSAMYNDQVVLPPPEPLGAMLSGIVPPPPDGPTAGAPFAFPNVQERREMYEELGGAGGGSRFLGNRYEMSALYGYDSLTDLLTFRGINDPSSTSPVETIIGGRYIQPGLMPITRRFSPLRDNRGFDVELPKPDTRTTEEIYAWSAFDVRQRLTTLSGARALKSSVIRRMPFNAAENNTETQLAAAELKDSLTRDEKTLFKAYCDALIPDSAQADAWPNGAPEFAKVQFQHYGYTSPEVGLVMAAHMAANIKDALDGSDTDPSAFTVLVDEDARDNGMFLNQDFVNRASEEPNAMAPRVNKWAWWVDGKRLDLGDNTVGNPNRSGSRLADTADGDQPPERAALNVYGIEPQPVLTAVASYFMYVDAGETAGGDPDYDYSNDADLNGEPDSGEATINGTVDASSNSDYLMQVVAFQLTNPFDQAINLTTGPGSGPADVNFLYYLEFNGRYFRLADLNWSTNTLSDVSIGPRKSRVFYALCASPDDINARWANHAAVSTGVLEWAAAQFQPVSNVDFESPILIEEFTLASGARIGYSGFTNLVGSPGTVANATNDQVRLWRAMRVIDPAHTPDEALTSGGQIQYPDNDLLVDRLRDPLTNTLEAWITDGDNIISGTDASMGQFHDDMAITTWGAITRSGEGGTAVRGSFPSYMIEAGRWGGLSKNRDAQGPGTAGFLSNLSFGDFALPGGGNPEPKLLDLINYQTDNSNDAVVAEIERDPASFTSIGVNLDGTLFDDVRVELVEGLQFGADLQTNRMRVGDLLLPPAVGAEYAPTSGFWTPDDYLTLGESLAMACNYDAPAAGLYQQFASTFSPTGPKVSRGGLVLDRFVPFFDDDLDQVFRATATSTDRLCGLGIPLALGVFEQFSGLPTEYVSLTRPIFGQVNISTASLPVLRCLPMLSPSITSPIEPWWSGGTAHGVLSDVAATVLAYRDKVSVPARPGSTAYGGALAGMFTENVGTLLDQSEELTGRFLGSRIDGIREQPGFSSVGELMAARLIDTTSATTEAQTRALPGNIDYLGFDINGGSAVGNSLVGFDSVNHGVGTTAMPNGYGERLLIANAVMNSVSVRSDYFAVWFVVNGYQKSDTVRDGGLPLGPEDPLVPSIQRRFLMVVDRSQVVKKGDKPRVVLFKEVPMS